MIVAESQRWKVLFGDVEAVVIIGAGPSLIL
jgi:hypothetical protein